jgi:single-stranded-DNA-specific exonuclease
MNVSVKNKIWRYRDSDRKSVSLNGVELPESLAGILARRGLHEESEINNFFNPQLSCLPSPFDMKGVRQGSELVEQALVKGPPVTIYGDYDVDGVTSTAFLYLFLKELGAQVSYYVPDRFDEGYGFDKKALRNIAAKNRDSFAQAGLLISVDCGISAVDEVEEARKEGFTVIITDHHQPPEQLPDADVIINPLQTHCKSPAKELAGVGVAFYFAMGIRQHLRKKGFWPQKNEPNLKKFLDLVAIGTIADMAPLTGVNRILVTAGLQVMGHGCRMGLASLLAECECDKQQVSGETVSFKIAPRINAAGRVDHAGMAVELLLADTTDQARQLAARLEEMNRTRRHIERQLFETVLPQAEEEYQQGRHILVLWGDFHPGVMGIVASRLTERFYRPAILLSVKDGVAKGSGRSIPGLNLFQCIEACSELLVRYGGHKAAAGMTVVAENLGLFRDAIEEAVLAVLDRKELQPELWVDSRVKLEDVFNQEFISLYSRLEPFGIGNPEPLFAGEVQKFHSLDVVGNDHLRFSVPVNGSIRSGIGFGFGNHLEAIRSKKQNTLAFRLRRNFFRGKCEWEMNLVDVLNNE